MSLPTVSGRGYLISDGVEVKFGKSGNAYARLPLSFKNRRRTQDGQWTHDKEVLVEGVVFGALAEWLADNVTSRMDLNVTGDLYSEEYEGKTRVKMVVHAAAPAAGESRPKVAAAPASSSWSDDNPPF